MNVHILDKNIASTLISYRAGLGISTFTFSWCLLIILIIMEAAATGFFKKLSIPISLESAIFQILFLIRIKFIFFH
jgi:hypothetical protein